MAAPENFQQDRAKLIEAVIYLCELSSDDSEFGLPKLTKMLYYADCESYIQYGAPVTGTTYLHFPHGPYPENWHQVREQMEQHGDIEVVRDTTVVGYQNYWLLPLRPPNLELLSPEDRESLEAQVKRFAGFNAAGIEQYSRQDIGWRGTEDGQAIPYDLAGVFAPMPSASELRRARIAN